MKTKRVLFFLFFKHIIDIDECTANTHSCQNGNCSNLIGSYTCNCFAGYRLSGQTCIGEY